MTSNGGDTARIIMDDNKSQGKSLHIIAIAVIVACVIAIVALIIAVVGLSRQPSTVVNFGESSGGSNSPIIVQSAPAPADTNTASGERVWRFHIGHFGGNTQYIDSNSGQVRGYDVDIVNAVCKVAGKNCIIAWDIYENCWNSQAGQNARGGQGLMGNWYDACIGWLQTTQRSRTFEFSTAFGNAYPVGLFVKAGGSLNSYPDLAGIKVGILEGWYSDEHCLAAYNLENYDQYNVNLIFHYVTEDDLVKALDINEIDVAFAGRTPELLNRTAEVTLVHENDFAVNECIIGGVSLMLPKANVDLLAWFNPAFNRLLGTRDYEAICNDLTIAHGGMPGYHPDDYCIQ